jgi:tRNA(Ile)-lysidine synthase TilS/MesJ
MNCLHKGEFAAMLPKLEMYDYGVTLIRPLIYVTEQELRTFSQHYGFGRVVCQCPYGKQTMRRQVDLVLSEMERLYPNARANLARAALIYGSDKAKRK